MAYRYLVPQETNQVLQSQFNRCENMGLILRRYVPQEVINNDNIPDQKNKKYRDGWLREICRRFQPDGKHEWEAVLRGQIRRWSALTRGTMQFDLEAKSRLIVGLGGKGTLEIGITLHQPSGLPYIPGSALKGLARSFALFYFAERRGMAFDSAKPDAMKKALEALEKELEEEHFQTADEALFPLAFGTQKTAGAVVFYDSVLKSIPDGKSIFQVDVMTPHFFQYYSSSGMRPPNDADNPVPVNFMTVTAGTVFGFAVGVRQNSTISEQQLEQAALMLLNGLEMFGIGAKTAAGYGAFGALPEKR